MCCHKVNNYTFENINVWCVHRKKQLPTVRQFACQFTINYYHTYQYLIKYLYTLHFLFPKTVILK